jgi:hypothetical protein
MNNPLNNIKKFINYLPSKDVQIGFKFLEKRDFENLKDLVDSAIIRTKKNIRSEFPKQEYLNVDLEHLNILKAEVDMYLMRLNLPEQNKYND